MNPPSPSTRVPSPPPVATATAAAAEPVATSIALLLDSGLAAGLLLALASVYFLEHHWGIAAPPVQLAESGGELAESVPPPPPPPPPSADVESTLPPPPPPPPVARPIDRTRYLTLAFAGTNEAGYGQFGVRTQNDKKLTFDAFGLTNNTMIAVDGRPLYFGGQFGELVQQVQSTGELTTGVESDKRNEDGRVVQAGLLPEQGPYSAIWRNGDVRVEQIVDYAVGDHSNRLDTIRIEYRLINQSPARSHVVGLRTMIDTFIGSNDGVPFFVPGQKGIVNRPLLLSGKDVPDYLLALERESLEDARMTIVHLGLGRDDSELPGRLLLSHWPGTKAAWDYDRSSPIGHDSAVGLYYDAKELRPRQTRRLVFTYGLGSLSSLESRNAQLSVTADGSLEAGRQFRLMALVKNPQRGQQVQVELPAGLTLGPGEPAAKLLGLPPAGNVTQESWVVGIDPDAIGAARVKVRLLPGNVEETYNLTIRSRKPAVRLVLAGTPTSGGSIRLAAQIHNAPAGQRVRLELPEGLKLAPGEPDAKSLSGAGAGQVDWVVHIRPGVIGSRTARATLLPENTQHELALPVQAGQARLTLSAHGDLKGGKPFWILARLDNADPGKSAELTLPPGLRLARGHAAVRPVESKGDYGLATWLVIAEPAKIGKSSVTVNVPGVGTVNKDLEILPGNLIGS